MKAVLLKYLALEDLSNKRDMGKKKKNQKLKILKPEAVVFYWATNCRLGSFR